VEPIELPAADGDLVSQLCGDERRCPQRVAAPRDRLRIESDPGLTRLLEEAKASLLDAWNPSTYRKPVRREQMPKNTTYTNARANFASLCDDVAETREVVIIRRRGARDVALVAADELESLIETAHLLRSPKNARRLITAVHRARSKRLKPQTVDKLRRDFGLGKEA
jgi:antitoxin YefM